MNLVALIEQQIAEQLDVKMQAQILFGAEANEWTHAERCERIAALFDGLWRDKGGTGSHPMSPRVN